MDFRNNVAPMSQLLPRVRPRTSVLIKARSPLDRASLGTSGAVITASSTRCRVRLKPASSRAAELSCVVLLYHRDGQGQLN